MWAKWKKKNKKVTEWTNCKRTHDLKTSCVFDKQKDQHTFKKALQKKINVHRKVLSFHQNKSLLRLMSQLMLPFYIQHLCSFCKEQSSKIIILLFSASVEVLIYYVYSRKKKKKKKQGAVRMQVIILVFLFPFKNTFELNSIRPINTQTIQVLINLAFASNSSHTDALTVWNAEISLRNVTDWHATFSGVCNSAEKTKSVTMTMKKIVNPL